MPVGGSAVGTSCFVSITARARKLLSKPGAGRCCGLLRRLTALRESLPEQEPEQ